PALHLSPAPRVAALRCPRGPPPRPRRLGRRSGIVSAVPPFGRVPADAVRPARPRRVVASGRLPGDAAGAAGSLQRQLEPAGPLAHRAGPRAASPPTRLPADGALFPGLGARSLPAPRVPRLPGLHPRSSRAVATLPTGRLRPARRPRPAHRPAAQRAAADWLVAGALAHLPPRPVPGARPRPGSGTVARLSGTGDGRA